MIFRRLLDRVPQKWMNRVFSLVLFAFFWVVPFLVLAYVANFSIRQSAVLAAITAYLEREISRIGSPAWKFVPYWVSIRPKWPELLTDLKLIHDAAEWDAIQTALKQLPWYQYRVLRSGILFTVIQESQDGTVIYRNDNEFFASSVYFRESLKPIHTLGAGQASSDPSVRGGNTVKFFTRLGNDGYDLGFEFIDYNWWDNVKDQCAVKPIEYRLRELILATIPYPEFATNYWQPSASATENNYEKAWGAWQKKANAMQEQRDKFGWKRVAFEDRPYDRIDQNSVIIENKYFIVEHSGI
jgi:hypothetical protein